VVVIVVVSVVVIMVVVAVVVVVVVEVVVEVVVLVLVVMRSWPCCTFLFCVLYSTLYARSSTTVPCSTLVASKPRRAHATSRTRAASGSSRTAGATQLAAAGWRCTSWWCRGGCSTSRCPLMRKLESQCGNSNL
jgi:hypothetical protein